MILLDYSQVTIASLMQQLSSLKTDVVEEDLLRHMILNSIRVHLRHFSKSFGELVVCCDSNQYWRKQKFAHYKANRKKDRDSSPLDWSLIFTCLNKLREELRQNFPYKVLYIPQAEADDIIGVLAETYGPTEKMIILSGDKDFGQLQKYPNVEQYNPIMKEYVRIEDPVRFLKEHIMKGDRGDGVPNFLSPDNSFVDKIRQSPVTQAKMDKWVKLLPEQFCDVEMLKNWKRNEMLVDLSKIPVDIKQTILDEFAKPAKGSRDQIYPYMVSHRLVNLLDVIGEF